jgi:hypothetical protein
MLEKPHERLERNFVEIAGAMTLILAVGFGLRAQVPEPEVRSHESAPPFQIRVETNLVMVRVVVRDAQGHPVAGMHKGDFRLFDNGKPREISGFNVETSARKPALGVIVAAPTTGTAGTRQATFTEPLREAARRAQAWCTEWRGPGTRPCCIASREERMGRHL